MKKISSLLLILIIQIGCSPLQRNRFTIINDGILNEKFLKLDIYTGSVEKIRCCNMMVQTTFNRKIKNHKVVNESINVYISTAPYLTKLKKEAIILINGNRYIFKVELYDKTKMLGTSPLEENISNPYFKTMKGKILVTKDMSKDILEGNKFRLRMYVEDEPVTAIIEGNKYEDLLQFYSTQ